MDASKIPEAVKKEQYAKMAKISYYHVVNGKMTVWHDKVVYLLNRGAKGKLYPEEVLEFRDCYGRMLKEPEHVTPDMQDYILARIEKFEKRYGVKVARPELEPEVDKNKDQGDNNAKET